MAVATATSTVYANHTPAFTHIGDNVVQGKVHLSGRTLSDIVFLAKVPNGVVITDFVVQGISTETASAYKLGINSAGGADNTFGLFTLAGSAIVSFARVTGCPFDVSLSDTDAQGGATIYATVSAGTHTTSISFDFMFRYRARGTESN